MPLTTSKNLLKLRSQLQENTAKAIWPFTYLYIEDKNKSDLPYLVIWPYCSHLNFIKARNYCGILTNCIIFLLSKWCTDNKVIALNHCITSACVQSCQFKKLLRNKLFVITLVKSLFRQRFLILWNLKLFK